METPNDIDMAIYSARLDGLGQMYLAAVNEYRKGVIVALCDWSNEFVGAATIELMADTDWRWTLNRFLDADGNEATRGQEFMDYVLDDLFEAGLLSELPDTPGGTVRIDVATATFAPGTAYELCARGV